MEAASQGACGARRLRADGLVGRGARRSAGGAPSPAPSTAPRAAIRLRRTRPVPCREPTPKHDPRSSRDSVIETLVVPSRRIAEHKRDQTDTARQHPFGDQPCGSGAAPVRTEAHPGARFDTTGRPADAVRSHAGVCGANAVRPRAPGSSGARGVARRRPYAADRTVPRAPPRRDAPSSGGDRRESARRGRRPSHHRRGAHPAGAGQGQGRAGAGQGQGGQGQGRGAPARLP